MIFKDICNKQHLCHPWTLPGTLPVKELTKVQKSISILGLIVGLPFAVIPGVCAFYAISGYFKNKNVQKLDSGLLDHTSKAAHDTAMKEIEKSSAKPILEDPVDKMLDPLRVSNIETTRLMDELTPPSDAIDLEVFVIGSVGDDEQQIPQFAMDAANSGKKVKVYNIDPSFHHAHQLRQDITTANRWQKVKKNHYKKENLEVLYYSAPFPRDESALSRKTREHLLDRVEKKAISTVFLWTCSAQTTYSEFFKIYDDFAQSGYRKNICFVHQYEGYPALIYGKTTPDTKKIVGTTDSPDRPTPNTLYAKWHSESGGREDDIAHIQWLEEHCKEYEKLDVKMYPRLSLIRWPNSFVN